MQLIEPALSSSRWENPVNHEVMRRLDVLMHRRVSFLAIASDVPAMATGGLVLRGLVSADEMRT
jgi:hypothetical protein